MLHVFRVIVTNLEATLRCNIGCIESKQVIVDLPSLEQPLNYRCVFRVARAGQPNEPIVIIEAQSILPKQEVKGTERELLLIIEGHFIHYCKPIHIVTIGIGYRVPYSRVYVCLAATFIEDRPLAMGTGGCPHDNELVRACIYVQVEFLQIRPNIEHGCVFVIE
jgi:hypothetical protein